MRVAFCAVMPFGESTEGMSSTTSAPMMSIPRMPWRIRIASFIVKPSSPGSGFETAGAIAVSSASRSNDT